MTQRATTPLLRRRATATQRATTPLFHRRADDERATLRCSGLPRACRRGDLALDLEGVPGRFGRSGRPPRPPGACRTARSTGLDRGELLRPAPERRGTSPPAGLQARGSRAGSGGGNGQIRVVGQVRQAHPGRLQNSPRSIRTRPARLLRPVPERRGTSPPAGVAGAGISRWIWRGYRADSGGRAGRRGHPGACRTARSTGLDRRGCCDRRPSVAEHRLRGPAGAEDALDPEGVPGRSGGRAGRRGHPGACRTAREKEGPTAVRPALQAMVEMRGFEPLAS